MTIHKKVLVGQAFVFILFADLGDDVFGVFGFLEPGGDRRVLAVGEVLPVPGGIIVHVDEILAFVVSADPGVFIGPDPVVVPVGVSREIGIQVIPFFS